jgi:DNA repair protein RadD
MKMILENPTRLYLPTDEDSVKRALSFVDKGVGFQISKLKKNFRWKNSDPLSFQQRLDELKEQQTRSLLMYDEDGKPYTYSGLAYHLHSIFKWNLESKVELDDQSKIIPWQKEPFEMRPYQKESVERLLKARHGAISIPTGGGKSLILLNLCKRDPRKTLIVTPLTNITTQLYDDFLKYFGKKYVGMYGDGKKDTDKLFTVATAQSLTRLEQGTEEYSDLEKIEVLMFDESHATPADTFESVCMGLARNAKCRYFTSATQLRTDGSELLLKGITGPVVYSKQFSELVDEGYLAKPVTKIFRVKTGSNRYDDPKTETRNNLYLNPNVNELAAVLANKAVSVAGRQTVILIEEFRQFNALYPHIKVPFEFVHGGVTTKETKDLVPTDYWKTDPRGAVERFNKGETKLLIGTSAISTGVDLQPVGCLIYMQGGISEIKVRQAIGRGTRIPRGSDKKDFWLIDFMVTGSSTLERHCNERIEIYKDMGDVEVI